MFENLKQALDYRTYRSALKEYEQQLTEHRNACQTVAHTFVSDLLKTIANDDSQEYVLVLSWYQYAFGTLATMLSNQLVKKQLPVFPEAPVKPEDPSKSVEATSEKSQATAKLQAMAWEFIKEALKKAQVPFKELAVTCEPILYINLKTPADEKECDLKDAVELKDDPNAVDIDDFL